LKEKQIVLIAFNEFDSGLLSDIASDINLEFNLPVTVIEKKIDFADYYSPIRRQYDGNKLLKMIEELDCQGCLKKIGLFRIDLYIPILTYIFGQAIYRGNSGVVSLYRLRNEQYGLDADNELLAFRFRKVIIHELGHTFGLKHCLVPNCVMRSSTYVEDIDQKQKHFCVHCQNELKTLLGV